MPTLEDVAGEMSFLDGAEPPADFLGARPREGDTVDINPPGLAWPPEAGSVAFDLELAPGAASPEPDFEAQGALRFHGLRLNLHALAQPLREGRWCWRYRCRLRDGRVTDWSVVRRFTIAPDAAKVPVTGVAELVAMLGDAHPRLYARPETLPSLRRWVLGQGERWDRLAGVIDAKLHHPLMAEPPPYPGDQWDVRLWRKYLRQARNMSSAADYLGFGYLITGDCRYGRRLREWLCLLSRWDPEGTSSYRYNDEVGMPVLFTLARGYDCGYQALNEEDRGLVRRALTLRTEEVYRMFRRKNPYEVRPYDNHATRTINFLGQAALSLLGEVPQAEEWLDYVLKVYAAFYPPWGGPDGGYSQGPMYLAAYLNWMLQFLHLLENATGIDFHQKPFFRNVGEFILYAEPHFARVTPFGDGMTRGPSRLSQLNMYRLAQKFRQPRYQWHAQRMSPPPAKEETVPTDLLEFLWHDESLPCAPPREPARCFFSVGVVAVHSNLTDPGEDVYLLFKSSPFGAWSHGYAEQNSFYLHGFGQPLAIPSGYYPWYGSPHHTRWTQQTRAHNSVLVDGRGQASGNRASRGRVDRFVSSERFCYFRGDAAEAYGGRLTRFHRHVLYVRDPAGGPGWFVIADDLEAPEPATFQWLLHARSRMKVDSRSQAVTIEEEGAGLVVKFLFPHGLAFEQTDEFDPPPEAARVGREFPPQWHLTASTAVPRPQAGFLVVLEPCRAGKRPRLRCTEVAGEPGGRPAVRVEDGEAEVLIGMRGGAAGEVTVGGVRTDARFFALERRPGESVARGLLCDGSFLEVAGTEPLRWEGRRTAAVQLPR